jgi:hypothetical protein
LPRFLGAGQNLYCVTNRLAWRVVASGYTTNKKTAMLIADPCPSFLLFAVCLPEKSVTNNLLPQPPQKCGEIKPPLAALVFSAHRIKTRQQRGND